MEHIADTLECVLTELQTPMAALSPSASPESANYRWPDCVPLRHRRSTRTLQNSAWLEKFNTCKDKLSGDAIIAILGPRGTGKTQMAASLIFELVNVHGKTALYAKAMDIFLAVRAGMKNNDVQDAEIDAIKRYIKPDVLAIDAYEVRGDTEYEARMLNYIIDKRYDSFKSTLIISNDTPESFMSHIGLSICDRIYETGGYIHAEWESFRRSKGF